ncbi:HesA/MoeB/ThiF family protein [Alkalicoccus urumqiensis]|uniref:Uncharacterized protein n=1 Tax=Alkalicoccus urumqiensis TaxID=1548213 RepID=A0A2P6MJK8_ALKUR|nr:ThiF family adenylyltransferase [Alkalicoccus urumqiensis]PRO66472.1 hypothetical protein C6I21_03790 [Alkalicoccus urumqiensis]
MSVKRIPNERLLKGRRATEFIDGIEIINDLEWKESINRWVIHCSLYSDEIETAVIPRETEWYILLDDNYPKGDIHFFPSKSNSLTHTFPHQMYNGEGKKEHPWRRGFLCLDANVSTLGKLVPNQEPFDEEERLYWYVTRAIEWLIAASTNTLTSENEPFELVDFPKASPLKVGFSETVQTFKFWNSLDIKFGLVTFSILNNGVLLVRKYQKLNGTCVRRVNWGNYPTQYEPVKKISGSWVILKEIPHIKPWQAPFTWGELTNICRNQGVELLDILRKIKKSHNFKNKLAHIILIGFPIKDKLNEDYSEIFWKGVEISNSFDNSSNSKGTKLNISNMTKNKHRININGQEQIKWMDSFNWSKKSVMSRGMLPKPINESKILIIGAGALGSSIGELLTRAGVEKLGIVDFDKLEMGNLTRHNLLLTEVGKSKAKELAERLNKTSVHGKVTAYSGTIKNNVEKNIDELIKYNLILDCTGEDEVLEYLQQNSWPKKAQFISISLGFGGERLFIFSNYGFSFQYNFFRSLVDPWLLEERAKFEEVQLPREGLGCWHPLFPARIDDIWIMAATAIKTLEKINKEEHRTLFKVHEYEKSMEGSFEGIKLVNEEVYDE